MCKPKSKAKSAPRNLIYTERGVENLSRYKARMALGKDLPLGAIVHHIDSNSLNDDNTNLLICPNAAYHNSLHKCMKEKNLA